MPSLRDLDLHSHYSIIISSLRDCKPRKMSYLFWISSCGSFICEMKNRLTIKNPAATNSAGVNEPSAFFNASMKKTKTTEACPKSWISPFDVPSGVGCVTSAVYCMMTGMALVRKNPSTKADTKSKIGDVAKVTPIKPGMAPVKDIKRNNCRL